MASLPRDDNHIPALGGTLSTNPRVLVPILANSDGQLHVVQSGRLDTGNSTEANLAGDAVFTGTSIIEVRVLTPTSAGATSCGATFELWYEDV